MITVPSTRRGPGRLQAMAFGLAALITTLDQAAKALARVRLDTAMELTPFLSLRLGFNPGVTFGLFADSGAAGRWTLSGVTALIIGALLVWIWRTRTAMTAVAGSLLVGGAAGNLLDRLRFGAVTDFTFNLADAAIVCGVGLLLLPARGATVQTAPSTMRRAAR